jgi:hypothetical protein
VTSVPGRTTAAWLSGTSYGAVGTSIFTARYTRFGSKKSTGSGSLMLARRRPFASYGLLGQTTLRPAVWMKSASGDWLW